MGDSCGLSDCGSVALSGVSVVTDVLVSPSSKVAVLSVAVLSDSDWEIVEPQSFSFSRKRSVVRVENHEGTRVKAPPASRKIMPPPPQQSSHSWIEAMQWQIEVEDQESGGYEKEFEGQHRWNARDRTVTTVIAKYLNKSESIKVEIEELESCLVQKTWK